MSGVPDSVGRATVRKEPQPCHLHTVRVPESTGNDCTVLSAVSYNFAHAAIFCLRLKPARLHTDTCLPAYGLCQHWRRPLSIPTPSGRNVNEWFVAHSRRVACSHHNRKHPTTSSTVQMQTCPGCSCKAVEDTAVHVRCRLAVKTELISQSQPLLHWTNSTQYVYNIYLQCI